MPFLTALGLEPFLFTSSFPLLSPPFPRSRLLRPIPGDLHLLSRPDRCGSGDIGPMDEFPGILARDFGFRPQGKSAPMAASKTSSSTAAAGSHTSSWNAPRSGWNTGDSLLGDPDDVFPAPPPRFSHNPSSSAASLDAIFDGFKEPGSKPGAAGAVPSSSLPVYDKPVYDDDIFDGVPGVKSSASIRYDDVFASMASGAGSNHVSSPPAYDDILANLGKAMPDRRSEERKEQDLSGFDELIPGFGGSGPPRKRETSEINQNKRAASSAKPSNSMPEDPFVVLETTSTSGYSSSGLFTDPLEHLGRPMNLERPKVDASSASGGIFDDSNAFDGHPKLVPLFTSEVNDKPKDKIPLNNVRDTSPLHNFTQKEPTQRSSVDTFEDIMPKVQSTKSSSFNKPVGSADVQSSETYGKTSMADQSPKSTEYFETADDVWLSISEIPLFTQPTSAPPPSRPPPSLVKKQAPFGANIKRKDDEYFPHHSQNYSHQKDSIRSSGVSPLDELEDFAMGKPPSFAHDRAEVVSSEEEIEKNSAAAASAAAMKEAMDRAEAKFKHAKEVRERERDAKFAKSRESAQQEIDEEVKPNAWDLEDKEMQERLEWEREQKEREEKEKEQKRLEKDRELELQRERDRARQAVERATREARDRAATEARLKAEKEARQRAERAAVQRAAAEARERAATDARERAAKVAAEARERAAAEARERAAAEAREREATDARERVAAKETKDKAAAERAAAERAAVNRAAAEARKRAERAAVERAAAEARERHAAAAREKQQKAENDLESFFGMGSRANSAPKQRFPSPETVFDAQAQAQAQAQARGGSDSSRRTSSGSASTIRKASSTTNIVDDLSSIFGAPSSGEFQEIDGESEERRRARLERHQRTLERAAKALAEKNERDMQTQRDQAERHRIAETLDFEIKRWSAGKEGNLRALLSTLQYVLWPECGWQPVSLTDLITAVAVKKVYRKATLCIHPDKVQQKGANLQQKYIAEKVFDLLKEAWNKFNSEELF